MAVRNTTNLPGALRSTDQIANTRCVLRAIDEVFGESSSGNMMITREWEVVIPEAVTVNGVSKILAGTKVKQYLPTLCFKDDGSRDDAKSDKALARLRDENAALKLPGDSIDDENPVLEIKNSIEAGQPVYADATVGSDEYTLKEPATPEQLAQGIKYGGDKIGADGKPEKGYRVKLVGILGRATPVAGQPW